MLRHHYVCFSVFFLIFSVFCAHCREVCTIPEVTVYPSRLEEQPNWGKSLDTGSLESKQQSLVTEALKQIPGVTVNSSGTYGPQSYIILRGANTEHTPVRFFGVEVNDSSGGARFDFSNMFAEDAQSFRISHASDLSAIGGAVDIEPRKGCGKPKAVFLAEGGSYQTGRTRAELSGSTARQHYFLSGNLLQTGNGKLKNYLHGNTVSDSLWTENLNARLGHQINDNWDADLYVSQSKSRYDINRIENGLPFKSSNHGVHQPAVIILKNYVQTWGSRWNHDIIVNRVSHRRDSSVDTVNYTDKHHILGTVYNTKLKITDHHHLMTALGIQRDQVKLSSSEEHCLRMENGEIRYRTDEIPRLVFDLKGRFDRHSFFKTHGTYRAYGRYVLRSDVALFSSYGTSFRAPTAFDFYASGPFSAGNPNLKPMTSQNFDIGTEITAFKEMSLILTYFHLDIKDLLMTIITPEGKFQRINGVNRFSEGVESLIRFRVQQEIQIRIGYTLTRAVDNETGRKPIRLPLHQASVGLEATSFKNTTLFVEGFYRHSCRDTVFFNNSQQSVTLPSSLTVRLGGAWHCHDQIEINGRIENLLNDHSENIYGYPKRGLSCFLGMKIKT